MKSGGDCRIARPDPSLEHDLAQPLLLERAHALRDLPGRAGETDGLHERGRDEARLVRVEEAVVAAVETLMPLGGRCLFEPGQVALPDRSRVFGRVLAGLQMAREDRK